MSSMVVDRGCQLEAKFIGSGRCLPVARGRAGSEGHVWPWNPTSPRRRAFHSNVPPLPLSLSLSLFLSLLPLYRCAYLPTPRLRVPFLSHCCSLSSPRASSLRLSVLRPVSSNSLSSFESRLLFENFTAYIATTYVPHRVQLYGIFPRENFQRPRFTEISFGNYSGI